MALFLKIPNLESLKSSFIPPSLSNPLNCSDYLSNPTFQPLLSIPSSMALLKAVVSLSWAIAISLPNYLPVSGSLERLISPILYSAFRCHFWTQTDCPRQLGHLNSYLSTNCQAPHTKHQKLCLCGSGDHSRDCPWLYFKPSHSSLVAWTSTLLPHTSTLLSFQLTAFYSALSLETLSGFRLALCSGDKFGQWSCYSLHQKQHQIPMLMNKTDFTIFFSMPLMACQCWIPSPNGYPYQYILIILTLFSSFKIRLIYHLLHEEFLFHLLLHLCSVFFYVLLSTSVVFYAHATSPSRVYTP